MDREWLDEEAAAKLGEKMMAKKTKRMSNRHDYGMEGDGKDLFLTMDGKRIAKRGHPGSRHARTWVSLEPGIVVRDVPGEEAVEIEVNGVRVH